MPCGAGHDGAMSPRPRAGQNDTTMPASPPASSPRRGQRLLDELHPIAVGHGQRLFEGTPTHALELVKHEALSTGVLNLTYAPAAG